MGIANFIVKNISKYNDTFCQMLLGDIRDENGEKYASVYAYEIVGFLSTIEHNLNKLEKAGLEITKEILKSQIVTNWFCDLIKCDMEYMDIYVGQMLERSKRDAEQQQSFLIEDADKEIIKRILNEEVDRNEKVLLNLVLKKDDNTTKMIMSFKEHDKDHYNHLIKDIKARYVETVNLLYKMFGEKPRDWDAGDSLHEVICRDYNIKREEFLF